MRDYSKLSDVELVQLVKQGEEKAFSQIYDRYWSVLFLHARKMLHHDEEAKDIVQNLFFRLFEQFSGLDFHCSLSAYLYKSVRNMVLDNIRHRKVVNRHLESFNEFARENIVIPEEQIRQKELQSIIESEIELLPPKMREVFLLSRRHYMSHKQISTHLGITEHTIKSQIGNAIRILRLKVGILALIACFLYK
ncbi:RNA polymerase sigma factor [Pedobacter nutrimenti]|uniref:RNA polymerase sigma-70 factor (ECF subfamily) n=1 Tax=Pedobacter nutrimenti TaxID=1241337 RepID=A0A318UN48_9SPHI|nr:RNA polymerase sigma-70 factor [Pedobacter nutrimenti]PYF77413.1 RNA polymerase sigma-70 factor (ECF subfamily) [Pedobacter nutrimenti]